MELNGKMIAGVAVVAALAAVYYTTGGHQHRAEPQAATAPAIAPAAQTEAAPAADSNAAAAASETLVGEASGSLNFWKYAHAEDLPGTRSAAGGEPISKIDLTPRSAVAIWNPGRRSLLVILLETATSEDDAKEIVASVIENRWSGKADALNTQGHSLAVLELTFRADTQTFDQSGLERASLVALASGGVRQPAQPELSNLQLSGSLPPSAADQKAGGVVGQVDISTTGAHKWSGSSFWHVAWNMSLALPVVLAK